MPFTTNNTTNTNTKQQPTTANEDKWFPDLFFVWRPAYNRWQMIRTVRNRSGQILRFKTAALPCFNAIHHYSGKPKEGTVRVGGRVKTFRRVGEQFTVSILDERSTYEQRIPVLDFVCWRALPRTSI